MAEKVQNISVNFQDVNSTVVKGASITNMSKQAFVRESVRVGAPLLIQAFRDLHTKPRRAIPRVNE